MSNAESQERNGMEEITFQLNENPSLYTARFADGSAAGTIKYDAAYDRFTAYSDQGVHILTSKMLEDARLGIRRWHRDDA